MPSALQSNEQRTPLDADSPDSIRMNVDEATRLGLDALQRLGYPADEARIIVDQLVDNALCGYKFAGLPRILAIAGDWKTGKARSPVRIIHETPVSATLDGGNNVGYIAAYRAAEVAIEKARKTGIAAVGAYNSYFSGRNAYYVERIVKEGLFAFHAASGQPHVLPPGPHGQTAAVRPPSPVCRRSHRPARCAAIAGHHRGPRARPCNRRPPTVPACNRGARRAGCAAASLHAAPRRALHVLWPAPIVDRSPKLPAGWSSPFRPIAQLRECSFVEAYCVMTNTLLALVEKSILDVTLAHLLIARERLAVRRTDRLQSRPRPVRAASMQSS